MTYIPNSVRDAVISRARHCCEYGLIHKVVDLLQSWIDQGDAEEQKETGEYLIRVFDKDRLADRRLFPGELKGITW